MKKLISVCAFFALTGCSTVTNLVDAYLTKYDTNQYKIVNDIRTVAGVGKTKCNDPQEAGKLANQLAFDTLTLMNFAEFQPHNQHIQNSSIELNKIAQDLSQRYSTGSVSVAFCKIKFQIIEDAAKLIQQSEGNKPK